MTPTFTLAEGCKAPNLDGIHEGYSVVAVKDYYAFTINVSSEHIPSVFLRLSENIRGKVFFTIETGTRRDVEVTLRKSDTDPFHKDVYYLDGLSLTDAKDVFQKYSHLLTHDGEVTFGIGSHEKNDEVFVGAYKIFYVYTVDPDKYRSVLRAMGLMEEPKIKTVWENFTKDTPGERSVLKNTEKTIWDMIDELKKQGLRFAERRED